MAKRQIRQLIDAAIDHDGLVETIVRGVHLFRVSGPVRCVPAVYEPTLIAIVSGSKEAILDGKSHVYDHSRYMCCAMSMPVEAGTPNASPTHPLLGVQIVLDSRRMTELAIEIAHSSGVIREPKGDPIPPGFALARWDDAFTDALLRLLQVLRDPVDAAVLGEGRLREVYYALLNGEAGPTARRAFGVGNEIARVIDHVSSNLHHVPTVDEMAARAGMSRAVFHRKFKQATTMSPIQFVKAIRLNDAAMRIASGATVYEAALGVGYASPSQFSREFKRQYGQSPRQWARDQQPVPPGVTLRVARGA